MSNRLKFRVWDGGSYLTQFTAIDMKGRCWLMDRCDQEPLPEGFIIEQCTGLKDKNGTLIYEGDILTPEMYKKISFATCIVTFMNGMFCFEMSKPFIAEINPLYKSLELGNHSQNRYEIIGNIHQNPELFND